MDAKDANGSLFLVATPIGNMEDITLRALRVLSEVSIIAAEDTRRTRKLLAHHGLRGRLLSYREQNHQKAAQDILNRMQQGNDVALVSDAGTPGISDPGQALVAEAVRRGFRVVPVPGASAAIAALSASGLPSDQFRFVGFLPRKKGPLRRCIESLASQPGSLVLYESPKRVGATLVMLAEVLGSRPAVVVRELTKVHETFDHGTLPELANRYAEGTRGEVILLVAGSDRSREEMPARNLEELSALVDVLRSVRGLSPGEMAGLLGKISGLGRKAVYDIWIGKGWPVVRADGEHDDG
jgi:16S rRNA (cytidine1402-2'-O)-methyltransferase